MSPGPQTGPKPPYNAKQGIRDFGFDLSRDSYLLAEKTMPKKSAVAHEVFGTFWVHYPTGRESL